MRNGSSSSLSLSLGALLIAFISLTGCGGGGGGSSGGGGGGTTPTPTPPTDIAVTGVTLNKSTTTIAVGSSETLKATVDPSDATNKTVSWKSSNYSVANVDNNGKVTGVTDGTATITVTTTDGSFAKTCAVTVTSSNIDVTDITPNFALTVKVGTTFDLSATVVPSTATNKTIVWTLESAGSTGSTLSGNTLTVGNTAGTIKVKATIVGGASGGKANYTEEFTITSNEKVNAQAPTITSITPTTSLITVSDQREIEVKASSPDGGNLSYQWYSNTTDSTTGGQKIGSATAATYTHQPSPAKTYYYFCEVTNKISDNKDGGVKSVDRNSSVVAVTVVPITIKSLRDYKSDYTIYHADMDLQGEQTLNVTAGTNPALPTNRLVTKITAGTNTHLIGRKTGEAIDLNLSADGALRLRAADSEGNIPIGSYAELQDINKTENLSGKSYKLEANLDLMSVPFTRIGIDNGSKSVFTGTFDGQGHTLAHLTIDTTVSNVGLFGYLGNGGTIKNLGIVSGTVKGAQFVGGLVGVNYYGTVTACFNRADVTGTSTAVGGVVGQNTYGTVTASYNEGAVTGNGVSLGGVVGFNSGGTTTASYNAGTVTKTPTGVGTNFGGVVGNNGGTLAYNYWFDHTGDSATKGIGNGTGSTNDDNATKFGEGAWPAPDNTKSWGVETADHKGTAGYYWQDLGKWNSGTDHVFPKLWWEE